MVPTPRVRRSFPANQKPPQSRAPPPVPTSQPPIDSDDENGDDYVEKIGTVPIHAHRDPPQPQDTQAPPPVRPRQRQS